MSSMVIENSTCKDYNSKGYAGLIDIKVEKIKDKSIFTKKNYQGLVKVSPTIYFDRDKTPSCFMIGLGGGYVEGEKYKNVITIEDQCHALITTQASTKVYKCVNNKVTEQETDLFVGKGGILEYITDNVILYRNAMYKQVNNIYMDSSSTLIYSDGITCGWSPDGHDFMYNNLQMKTSVYMNDRLVLLDNLLVNPKEDDVKGLGYFEGYKNFGTLLVIDRRIDHDIISILREEIKLLNLDIDFGISKLEVNGFVIRILGNFTQDIESVIFFCQNYIRSTILKCSNVYIRKC